MQKYISPQQMIKKYGEGSPGHEAVKCQGCGEYIRADDLGAVDYSLTKRKSIYFWHSDCYKNVWNHGIE